MAKSVRICPVCKENNKEILFHQRFQQIEGGSLFDGYDIVACQNCGFCFADNIPDQKDFDVYYKEMSKYEHQDRSGQASEFETRQFPALANFIAGYIPDPNAKILEVGCANGGLLNAIKGLGYRDILGMDPSPVCARNAETLYQIPVATSALSDFKAEKEHFDFIILVAVLEHIKDLDSALLKLYDLLSPEGRLYIEVPDVTTFATSPDAPFQEFSIEHINYFSSISLSNLVTGFGFSKVTSATVLYNQTDTHTGNAIRMVFQKDLSDDRKHWVKDTEAVTSLKEYIIVSQKVEQNIHQIVNNLVDSQTPLIVWGVGTHTQRLLATSKLSGANIIAFVDSNPNYQGKVINNIPILNPKELAGSTAAILISSRIFQNEIASQIRSELKLDNKLIVLYED